MFKEKIDNKEINKLIHRTNKVMGIIYLLVVILFILVATFIIKEWNILSLVITLISVISPVFIGFILAWLLDPLATKLEKKMPRVVACLLTYLIIFLIIVAIIGMLIPALTNGVGDLVSTLPEVVDNAQEVVNDFFNQFEDNSSIMGYKKDLLLKIENIGKNLTETLPDFLMGVAKGLISGGANLILGVMIGFYLLFDFKKVQGHILSLLPDVWHENAKDLMRRINGKLRNYVQGVLLVMLLVFITQSIGLSLAGLKAPILFALFCAVTDIIPYIGPWIGGVPAVIIGFTIHPTVGIFALISIVVCQVLENNFYQPLIMGKALQLHPVTIMLGLLIFNYFFGMIGMIVATPVIASLKIIFEFIEEKTGIGKKFHNYQKKEHIEETVKKKSTKRKTFKESSW